MVEQWLALVIGNSRLHWARFEDDRLLEQWDEAHDQTRTDLINCPLWIASVVPAQNHRWETYSQVRFLTLADVPLQGMYESFGIDRALALWGAIATIGSPVLVIDCGTALTFTAADATHHFVGGAILPGLHLQFTSLGQKTALLPTLSSSTPSNIPARWAKTTEDAIASGILYTVLAGIQAFCLDWWQQCPDGSVVMTGGDGDRLYSGLQHSAPHVANRLAIDTALIFRGMQAIKVNAETK